MDFSKESYDATWTEVYDGVYVLSETHRPHHKDSMPELNNRAFIFQVTDEQFGEHFLMSGMPGSPSIKKAQALESAKGLKIREIITSGDFHHMSMKGWLDAYPEATFYHSNLKFPTTRNGKEILANEDYKKRIVLCDGFDIPAMAKYSDSIQFFAFNQFLVYPDQPFMTQSESTKDKPKENIMSYMMKIPPCTEPFLAIWVYHVPSKQLIIEHNFEAYLSKEQIGKAAFMIRHMMSPLNFGSAALSPMPTAPADLEACKTHCEQMAKILELDVAAINDYHFYPGQQIREYESKEEFVKDFTAVLAKTGEDDVTGQTLFNKKTHKKCIIL